MFRIHLLFLHEINEMLEIVYFIGLHNYITRWIDKTKESNYCESNQLLFADKLRHVLSVCEVIHY